MSLREPQRALQLGDALDLERERHPRLVLAGHGVDGDDVDLLAREQLRQVAQQPLPVARLDQDVDREHLLARRAPVGVDQALGFARAYPRDVQCSRRDGS